MLDTVLRNGRVVLPGRGIFELQIGIRAGKVAVLAGPEEPLAGRKTLDAGGRFVLPGLVEPHAHLCRSNGLQEWGSETAAAALSGVTTIFSYHRADAPYGDDVRQQVTEGEARSYIDFALHLGIVTRRQVAEMPRYREEFGVSSFKFYMAYRGEAAARRGLPPADDGLLLACLQQAAGLPGSMVAIHAENGELVEYLAGPLRAAGRDDLAAWAASRPAYAEAESIRRAVYLATVAGCPVYLVHVSSAAGLEALREWRSKHPGLVAETCPSYLTLTADTAWDRLALTNPPLRGEGDREALWRGVLDGAIDTLGSDHVTFRRGQKDNPVWENPPGFPGTFALLPLILNEGVHKRGLPLERVAELTALNPARAFGIYPQKGTLEVGSDADLVLVDLALEREMRAADFPTWADYTPFDGMRLRGWPVLTMVRGEVVAAEGRLVGRAGHGRYLFRG